MTNFFEQLPYDAAGELEQLSRLAFDLREQAKAVLQPYGVDTPDALLDQIRTGGVAEHPAYDHYLSACVLGEARDAARAQLAAATRQLAGLQC